ncbi:hypothetical protein Tco_0341196 [Tanacetum coccineum]
MARWSKDRPPMLGPGRYSQWRSRFLRYIDTKPNGEGLRKSILSGPYVPSTVLVQAVAATEGVPAVQQHTTIETILNMTPENKEHFYNYYQAPKPQRSNATSSSTRPSASTRHKGKEIAKLVTPQSESVSEEDSDPEQAQRDTDMQKNLALLAKYFKRLYKPTNNNLRTSSNSRNKTEDTTPRKPKRVKNYSYHKEKMMMCKQVEQGVPLQAKQADWLADTDEEIDKQELEAHYSFMAKIQEVLPEESSSTEQPLEQFDKAGLVGAFIGIGNWFCAVEERSVVLVVVSSDIGRVGVKGNSVFGKMVSKTKYGLFEVLIVSKWNSKSTIKEFACSLKQVMEMVVVPSLMIALKQ